MNKKLLVFVISIIVLITSLGGYLYYSKQILQTKKESVHFHAGFQVYKDGALVDFSSLRYMHEKPCTVDRSQSEEHEDDQIEKAHLHDRVGDVVHVHRKNVVWGDLFKNLNYKLDIKNGYINGKEIVDVLNHTIKPYDSLVILIGEYKSVDEYLKNAVTKKYMQDVEKRSENCGS